MFKKRKQTGKLKTNDIAGKTLSESKLDNVRWMLLSRIKRGETLKLEEFNQQLIDLLRQRAIELEKGKTLDPVSVTDWMALALFAEDRDRLAERCREAEGAEDRSYKNAAYWLRRLMYERGKRRAKSSKTTS